MKIILTGSTGFVGEGVLLECLSHPQVTEVLIVNRKPSGMLHPKLRECTVPDFMNLNRAKQMLKGYDACFYCAGTSAAGLNEGTYTRITYDTTIRFAETLLELNPDMIFNFVSGRRTDSSGKGNIMWARVKGKTENALKEFAFRNQYNFRPGFMKPTPGQQNVKTFYKIISEIWPLVFPKQSCLMKEVGLAMINAVIKGYPKQTLEVEDIKELAGAKHK